MPGTKCTLCKIIEKGNTKNHFQLVRHSFLLWAVVSSTSGGVIHHNDEATSYQHFEIEHYHAVPTYLKHEDKHLLEHPLSAGKTTSEVKIHHEVIQEPLQYSYGHPGTRLDDSHLQHGALENESEPYQMIHQHQLEQSPGLEPGENQEYQLPVNGNEDYEQYKQLAEAAMAQYQQQIGPGQYHVTNEQV
ncbi:uncharacterized protein LOC132704553 isoform X2 [Cylas formicarius]|uniref:uncharacterized protein LOC132704553 isoform X2 n=1 Tax=Cylas formicarius TaxID=197179 RepID=UPI00295893D6|nr:uncharacterized protein LOC132704553 isoform X2 [Cylas formicarius]